MHIRSPTGFAAEESGLVSRSRAFAESQHGDQRRKYSGEPYIVHLDAVAAILRAHGVDTPQVIAAAYLHDTVEDTDATIQSIAERFGDEIAELVYWLTDAEKGKRKIRKKMSAWRLGRAPWDAKMIKLADLIDNTADICRKDRHFAPVYLREKREILESMVRMEGERLTSLALFREAARIRTLRHYDLLYENQTVVEKVGMRTNPQTDARAAIERRNQRTDDLGTRLRAGFVSEECARRREAHNWILRDH